MGLIVYQKLIYRLDIVQLMHVCVYNRRDYDVIETLDDHSASITAVKFACNGSKLLSCSADKYVMTLSL